MGDETKVQLREVKKGVEAMGSVVERYMMRYLGPVGKMIASASRAGRIMALVGVVAVIVSLILILVSGVTFRAERVKGALVASKSIVNVRDRASTRGKVVAKAERGERLVYLGSDSGWYKVRARGSVGWVSEDMVERKGNRSVVIEYEMKGYGIVFLAGLGLFIVGILQKKK